jgi:hypothetical protein
MLPPSKNHGAYVAVIDNSGEVSTDACLRIQFVIRRDIHSLRHWIPENHAMNEALRGLPDFVGMGCHSDGRHALLDTGVLIAQLARRPTHVSELVCHEFNYVGFCDASAFGAGGVWFSGNKYIPPTVWRVEFPPDITAEVTNPDGKLTNSDLEMAGVLLHYLALEQIIPDLMRSQAVIGCDNTPSVAWTRRMAT